MKKFEYTHFDEAYSGRPGMIDLWESMGEKGWELVSVDHGIAYFKREIVPPRPTEDEIRRMNEAVPPP